MSDSRRTVSVEGIARVEGEGSLHVTVRDGAIEHVELEIFEPPRFFEALLRGRLATEAPDITSRICGICPVAYQLTACAAVEDAYGVAVGPRVESLRRLLYCGEWIQSHALHVHLLHAPDFLGFDDAVAMAEHESGPLERGLRLKKAGNLVMEVVGGRAVHPVNVRVGGFFRAPDPLEIAALAEPLGRALDDALEALAWVAGFEFPDHDGRYRFVALRAAAGYPLETGRVASSFGLDASAAQFDALATEQHVAHSSALHARIGGEAYLTGPLARYALNADRLGPLASEAAHAAGLDGACTNPYRSIVVRCVELVYAIEEALRLVSAYEPPEPPAAPTPARPGTGFGVTEAPRGLILHRYDIEADGTIGSARIVPPTSQNQPSIESDLAVVAAGAIELGDEELARRCERAVRNHDPCISCAAHFLDVHVERR